MHKAIPIAVMVSAALLLPHEARSVAPSPGDRSKAADDMANNFPTPLYEMLDASPPPAPSEVLATRISDLEQRISELDRRIGEELRKSFARPGTSSSEESRLTYERSLLMEELDGLRSIVPELEGIVVIAFAPSALDAAPLSGGLMLPAQQQGVRRTGRSAVSVQAHAARFDFGGAVDRGGDVRGITASASRRFDDRTTASVFASVRRGEIKSNRLTSSLDQTQVSAGLAVVRRLSERVVASVLAYFGRADNDINLDGGIGSFDTTTLGAIGRLQGRWSFYPWVVEPHVILDVRRVSRDGYTDTAAVVVPGSTRTYGTLSVGKRVSRPHFYDGQSGQHSLFLLEPYWQVDGHWRFAGAQDQTLPNSGPLVLSHARLHGSVAAGVNAVLYSGHQSGAQIAYHGIGSRYEAVSGTLQVTFPNGARLGASLGFAAGGDDPIGWNDAPLGGAFAPGVPAEMFASGGPGFFAGARLTVPLQ